MSYLLGGSLGIAGGKSIFFLPKTGIFLEYLIESVKVQFLSKINPNRFRSMPEKYNILYFVAFFSVNI